MTSLRQRHMEALKSGVEMLRTGDMLTDMEIVINHRIFRCHKSILVAMSPYFRAMFTTGMRESNQKRITIHDVDEIPFEKFLDFLYNGEIDLLDDDVVEMLRISALFQVDCLQEQCENTLREQLKADNCVEIFRLSCLYNCKKLKKKSWHAILDGFCTVWKSEDFLDLTAEEIIAIIREDSLVTIDEEHVCEAVIKWVNADVINRKQHMSRLLQHVRLPHLTPEYLVNTLCKVPYLMAQPECRELIDEVQHYHMLPSRQLDHSGERFRYRVDDDLDEVLLVITDKGDERSSIYDGGCCLWAFSFCQHRWFTLASITAADSPGSGFAFCSLGYDIFVSGGSNKPKGLLKFESERNEWISSTGLLKKGRREHCMVAIGNSLFSLGGKNTKLSKTHQAMGSIEEYYIPGQRWKTVGELAHPVYSAESAVSGERVLVFGGTSIGGKELSCVQSFHSRTRETTVISNLPYIPKRLLSLTIGETLYIVSFTDDGYNCLRMTPEFGFVDAGFEIPSDQHLLAVSHHDGCLITLLENSTGENGDSSREIYQINLVSSSSDLVKMKSSFTIKPVHGCHRAYIDKRFLYHTYFQ